jgi:hypothetical protein
MTVMVGCVCANGKVYPANGTVPMDCPHCGGAGVVPRLRYLQITGVVDPADEKPRGDAA